MAVLSCQLLLTLGMQVALGVLKTSMEGSDCHCDRSTSGIRMQHFFGWLLQCAGLVGGLVGPRGTARFMQTAAAWQLQPAWYLCCPGSCQYCQNVAAFQAGQTVDHRVLWGYVQPWCLLTSACVLWLATSADVSMIH